MKLTAEVLHGTYLGDVCAQVYQKGKVCEMPDVLEACRHLGMEAVRKMRTRKDCQQPDAVDGYTAGAP